MGPVATAFAAHAVLLGGATVASIGAINAGETRRRCRWRFVAVARAPPFAARRRSGSPENQKPTKQA